MMQKIIVAPQEMVRRMSQDRLQVLITQVVMGYHRHATEHTEAMAEANSAQTMKAMETMTVMDRIRTTEVV